MLIAIMEGLSVAGFKSAVTSSSGETEIVATPAITNEPRFAELDGSLFLAIQTDEALKLNEGTVVEFKFKRKELTSFHVNDANQDVLNQGEADVLVMIHQDLALALKSEKLLALKIIDGDQISTYKVNDFWQPHSFLSEL